MIAIVVQYQAAKIQNSFFRKKSKMSKKGYQKKTKIDYLSIQNENLEFLMSQIKNHCPVKNVYMSFVYINKHTLISYMNVLIYAQCTYHVSAVHINSYHTHMGVD